MKKNNNENTALANYKSLLNNALDIINSTFDKPELYELRDKAKSELIDKVVKQCIFDDSGISYETTALIFAELLTKYSSDFCPYTVLRDMNRAIALLLQDHLTKYCNREGIIL